ncbi:serine/threonine protein kinase [Phytophthora infestans T30-4]|uniref:Serine/threonine protein kinase n=1 Tax=Phytophthora infestans (strain T30-4) TaxID=403677 RepID=D0NGK1_PHYIT|nr:serine/threonine protein kinase [Phytophthora infestans T30-4]EEY57402.1 serine/threonine protein kinase [Phytophthora infestans T30-4]|eukprot:XP_002902012.1 serine/threonine protein kinase [Phytophthora infestans T30-4]
MAKPRRASYAVTSAELPVLKTLGLEEVDPEDVFELQRKEGAGAFGRVFRACYKKDRARLAALKVIPVALEAGERGEDIESVRREIQFLRECDHPNVVAFHGAYYKDGALWVAMEHCAGGSVGDVRRVRSLNEREISIIMRGALNGLAYLHSRRKIHRDVKGGNILLTDSGQVKIADFGVSAQLRDTLSRRGSFVGTPYWMSPELIQDSDYDFKADIWSLGITAIELADQKPPLFDEHPMRVLIQIPRNPPPQVAHPEKWSAAFLDFLRFCLRKDPAERPTAVECMQHEFIRREAHIERVFAGGEKPAAPTVEQELDNEIAEEISDASSSSHSDVEGEASTGLLGETFEFRAQSPMVPAKLQLHASASADDLLTLSTDELPALSQKDNKLNLEHRTSTTASFRQPATEFKLLPSSAKSPVMRGSTRDPSARFVKLNDSRTSSDVSLNSLSISSDVASKRPPRSPVSLRPKASSSPPTSPSVKSSWLSVSSRDDPLASIDTVTNARVNRLLSSLSTSTSSPSLAAAMRAYNDQYTVDSPNRHSRRQSFNWRSETALGATNREGSTRSSGKIFVGDPFRASHDVCVKYNSIQAQYEGAPMSAEWAALHKQFGIALSHMRCRQGTDIDDQVPALVRMLRRELARHGGLKCKYIFRVSPVQDEVQRAKAAINRGSFEPAQVSDPHVYASLLKLWLRELPVLLLDVLDVHDLASVTKLVTTGKLDDDDDLHLVTTENIDLVDAQIARTLQKLGQRENAVFQWLLEHMLEVNTHRSVNQMTTQALATVMAPNVFSCAGMARSTQENAGNLMKQIVLFLRVLLSWRRASLPASTYLLEQEEKNVAAAFSTKAETANVSTMQHKVRQSLTKLVKSPETPESESELVSFETALRSRVDQLWSDLEKSEVTTVETQRQENVLRRVFSEFQLSTLQLIVRYAKKREECTWANLLLENVKENKPLETKTPASLGRMKDLVDAALTFEAFCRLLDREQTTQEKLEKLQTRLGDAAIRHESNQVGSLSRNIFYHLSRTYAQQLKTSHSSNQIEDTSVSRTLLNGAVRLAARSGNDAKLHRNVAKLGERQPAIGNLLVLLGECSQRRRQSGAQSLEWLQTQLMESIPPPTTP